MIPDNVQAVPSRTINMLIGGRAVGGTRRLPVMNPANPSEEVGTLPLASTEDVCDAVRAAKAAQREWGQKLFSERSSFLSRGLARCGDDLEPKTRLFSRENGKTLAEAQAELSDIPKRAQFTLALAPELDNVRILDAVGGQTMVRPCPFGVVAAIAPWNAPVSLACMQVIPALLCGNSVVVKPPESCPLTLVQTLEAIAAELPSGVLNIVTGLPSEIGDVLTRHPDIGKISFVGGVRSARGILCNAADTVKSVTVELGGNDAAIILEDADLGKESLRRMATSIFRMAGQVCMAIKRIYVPDGIHDKFTDALGQLMDEIVVGAGTTPGVTMGPLHTRSALERTKGILADAQERGATLREYGKFDDQASTSGGYFVRPTMVTDVCDDARVVIEEQFCPVIPVLRYRTVEEALDRANSTIFGLGGSVWSRDTELASSVAVRLQAGTVFVNSHGTNSVNRKAPYGGVKQSGTGRRGGLEGILEYAQLQTLTTCEQ